MQSNPKVSTIVSQPPKVLLELAAASMKALRKIHHLFLVEPAPKSHHGREKKNSCTCNLHRF
jgi:hypothetical protein